ncbi:hypothetical protein MKZ38_001775 [Zalerion maritima]|uniref:Trichothecene 3-O-acetyltransferase-like N-terminal domain-containing protein n=1 Tax=Zalerion maritima TaxID=339359 RepID=A0AAD5RYN6_9PEZI|nr:hypothetical protein MKZ38_001775 [Zalerion maritima]
MDPNDSIDILGQQPLLRIYTQISLCFPVPDPSFHATIIKTLTSGLERLTESFPWVAGQIANEEASEGNTGVFRVKPLDDKIPRLTIKDLRYEPDAPTMDALRRSRFPFSMLDESAVAPCKTMPPPDFVEFPVFFLQATFVTGGLLLTFVGGHQVMDMTGQGHIIHLLSKACREEPFTDEELTSGNRRRRDAIPLLDDLKDHSAEIAHQIVKSAAPLPPGEGPPPMPISPKCTWGYFIFLPAALTALKAAAMKGLGGLSKYISTDDTLSAFIWQSTMRARLPRLDKTLDTSFARAVDVRPHLGMSKTYPGLVQNMTYHTYTIQDMVHEPLGVIAANLRSALHPEKNNLGYMTRALATCFDRTPDKSVFSFIARFDLSKDMMLSSWAKVDCYGQDFGLGLGKPEAVRRPKFDAFESLVYLMPKKPDGEVAVAICLRDEDMERLRRDPEVMMYSTYVG